MYEELVKRLNAYSAKHENHGGITAEAADAIEELEADKAALNGTVTNLLEQIKDLASPRWIPVTERLPKKWEPVYAAVRSEGRENWVIEVNVYDPYLACPWGRIPMIESGKAEVYAWMPRPLPEPPKEET